MVFNQNQIFTKGNSLLSVPNHPLFYGFVFLFLTIGFSSNLQAQNQRDPVELTAGVELRALIPVSFFTMDPVTLRESDGNFTAEYSYKGGMGFGGVIRVKFTELLNLETGIYYTRRKYEYKIEDPSVNFKAVSAMRTIGYEIPLKGLVYIQMGRNIFMDVALGASADFFASDIEIQQLNYDIVAFKKNWIKVAVLGNIGVEYRTEESGYFYIGATLHQSFGDILTTQVNYSRNNTPPPYFQNGNIDGSYFSVDFRYFFPPSKPKKKGVKYVVPDWKNM